MAINQTQFDADLQTFLANVAVLINENALLIAKATGNAPVVDLTSEDTGINSANASVMTAIASAKVVTGQ